MIYKSSSWGDHTFDVLIRLFIIVFTAIVLYPLIYVVSASLSHYEAVISGKVFLWPVDFSVQGYKAVMNNDQIWTGFKNSLMYMVVGTFVNLIMTVLAAYPLSRRNMYGRNVIMGVFVFTIFFQGGLIPSYLLAKNLNLLDSFWVMILPTAMSVFNVIITRTYIQSTIPEDMYEAGQIDGASDFHFMLRVVVPLSGPILAVMGLYYGVGHWNSYFNALIFLKSPDLFPIQLVMRNILILNNITPQMFRDPEMMAARQNLTYIIKYAVIVVASLPVIAIYPFVQRYFVKGVMIGSLKG